MEEKVPRYDGTPEQLPAYREKAIQYTMGMEWHKRYLCGPRLLANLTGVAKTITRPETLKNPQWLSHPRGTYTLLEFLESHLSRPSLVDASRHVLKYFYNLGRQRGESMTEWISRHSESLWEASIALRRVQRDHEGHMPRPGRHRESREQTWPSEAMSRASDHVTVRSGPFRDDGRLDELDDEQYPSTTSNQGEDHWSWNDWGQSWTESQDKWGKASWYSDEYAPPHSWDASDEIFIPEFLAGFLLLHRSGLEPSEKANILGSIRGEFSTTSVGRALREQWSDQDLAKRDKSKGPSACFVEDYEDVDEAFMGEESEAFYSEDPDIMEAFAHEQETINEALEAIRTQKATLKEARWNQKQIRLGRNFYTPKPFQKGHGKGTKNRGQIQCFRCGGPHVQAQCPRRHDEAKAAAESAEIAFMATTATQETENEDDTSEFVGAAVEAAQVASEVLEQCMGIIDSGATASLGSIDAMEALAMTNLGDGGDTKMNLDFQKRPTFRFGNGMAKTCVSTAQVQVQAGEKKGQMEVHVHDAPGQPILVSRRALKSLGAVIDFENNEVIYKNVDRRIVVPLIEAANGHLLMPLAGNLLHGGHSRANDFLSLKDE